MPAEAWLTARPIAHRGLHDAAGGVIENSLSAAAGAIAGNFAIECDVQLSADEDAVVFHDFVLDRLTAESGRVDARKVAELAQIGLKGAASDRIPTLTAFLDAIGGQTPLVIEVKSRFDGDLRLAKRTAEILAGHKGQPIVLKSFDPVIVAALHEFAPGFARGIVAMNEYGYADYDHLSATQKHALANLLHFEESRPDFVSWKVADLPSAAPFLCRKALGLPLMSWTVRSAEDRARAAEHADQMVFEGFLP